jgi:hypothetical protein
MSIKDEILQNIDIHIENIIKNNYFFDVSKYINLPGIKIEIRVLSSKNQDFLNTGEPNTPIPKSQSREYIKSWLERFADTIDSGCLSLDTEEVILTMSNGKTITFGSSEWLCVNWDEV